MDLGLLSGQLHLALGQVPGNSRGQVSREVLTSKVAASAGSRPGPMRKQLQNCVNQAHVLGWFLAFNCLPVKAMSVKEFKYTGQRGQSLGYIFTAWKQPEHHFGDGQSRLHAVHGHAVVTKP